MEAIELAKEETFKKKEHEALCKSTGKQVGKTVYFLP